ncbi:MAG TPA: HAD family hydrolase [Clostridia bacterium]|nr:HAD family hydrolase [Clostridia bacterium]HRX42379.1 HAD family hydrolase [Clostridia bacterium]
MNIRPEIICFDADDTLWVNETFYQDIERDFIELMARYADRKDITEDIHRREVDNLEIYGYGAKGFMLSMIETALNVSNGRVTAGDLDAIIKMGRGLINEDILLLDGVEETLGKLSNAGYKLIVATKGDLLDQERKLRKSGLSDFFDHIEIMSFKRSEDYRKLLHNLGVEPFDFLMVGNSMKSDIIPVLEIGGYGIHVPFHTTWAHEIVEDTGGLPNYLEIENIREMLDILEV